MRRNGGGRSSGGGGGAGAAAGAGGGDGFQAARNFFLSLFGGGLGGGGGAGGAARGRGGGAAKPREGEWRCRCGFATNRAHREACFACGRARAAAEVRRPEGGKATLGKASASPKGGWQNSGSRRGDEGPVGADGSRPLLGRHGHAAVGGKPMGVKGHTVGMEGKGKGPEAVQAAGSLTRPSPPTARGEEAAEGASGAGLRPMGAWVRPPPVVDSEGYRLVQPNRVRLQTPCDAPAAGEVAGGAQCGLDWARGPASRQRWADTCSDDPEDAVLEDLEADERAGDVQDEEHENERDPRRLRAAFEAHAKAVRDLERCNKGQHGNPALATLRAARDAAEREWREAKEPAPLPTRMGRAEAKLEKAAAALTRARLAVDEFDEWAASQRSALVNKMEEADRWYRWRQSQLDELHGEAGNRVSDRGGQPAGRHAVVSGRIKQEMLPELQAVLEYVQGNPEIVERLAHIAAGLESAGEELESPHDKAAERYDIGDCDSDGEPGWEDDLGAAGTSGPGERCGDSACGPGARTARPEWKPEGAGRWSRATPARTDGPAAAAEVAPTGTAASAISASSSTVAAGGSGGPCVGHAAGGPPPVGGGQAGLGEGVAQETAHAEVDDDNEEPESRRSKHRRRRSEVELREEADRRRAEELLQQQQRAEAAQRASHQAGAGGFGSDTALTEAARKFVEDVQRAESTARSKGIEPRAGEKKLLEFSPAELQAWIDDNLWDAAYL